MMLKYSNSMIVSFLMLTSSVVLAQTPPYALTINDNGNIGMGTTTPERQLHLKSDNAVFRMDRPSNTAAFMLVRTTAEGIPLKTFVVGTDASASNTGEFVINDLGTAVSGSGTRRLTLTTTGDAVFTGTVRAPSFVSTSSRRFKQNIEPLTQALARVQQLQGVHFTWKESGQPALGLIAEDVAPVIPEVVEQDPQDGQATGVNYMALVAVLIEAIKEQQGEITTYQAHFQQQQLKIASLETQLTALEAQTAEFKTMKARLTEIESLLAAKRGQFTLAQRSID